MKLLFKKIIGKFVHQLFKKNPDNFVAYASF